MTLRLLITCNLLLLATPAARAQTADDFFNGGAQFYISNNVPAALQKVETGRKVYPDDVKLKKLEELLKQQQQSQSQQNQQNQQNQQQNQSSQSKNQQSQSQNQQRQNQQPQQSQNQQNQQAQNQQSQQNRQNEQQNQQEKAQAMTPQEARQLLDAQKGDEQVLLMKPKGQPENPNPTVKDW